eukprot:CAMPEP_0185781428 /NCGR_PEP_ID=MMETSP1174-20130828/102392_1 /TAXON_ID=35687 /ORGANISM="Dictyocha speculum, Strain CCMP1381" /LENGTH=433 /DNA_ID=CAMNT_0028471407 /DNA_START=52 /DNA_END=1350 /DNA_ORIENTATION=-
MAALFRQKEADYVVSEHVEVDTQDHEDHTFSGVMFTIEAKTSLPVDFIQVDSISVRGALGPMTVWVTPDSWEDKYEEKSAWQKIYDTNHTDSFENFVALTFTEPVIIPKSKSVGMYVHSKRQGDESIVYDDQRARYTHSDQFIRVGPGLAHLSNEPFSGYHPWGAWRERRQFVGRVSYGAKFQLWQPECHAAFPPVFKDLVNLFLMTKPQDACPISWMSNDILFYILNMLRHDWIEPSPARAAILAAEKTEKQARKRANRNARRRLGAAYHSGASSMASASAAAEQNDDDEEEDRAPSDDDDDDDDSGDEDDDIGLVYRPRVHSEWRRRSMQRSRTHLQREYGGMLRWLIRQAAEEAGDDMDLLPTEVEYAEYVIDQHDDDEEDEDEDDDDEEVEEEEEEASGGEEGGSWVEMQDGSWVEMQDDGTDMGASGE